MSGPESVPGSGRTPGSLPKSPPPRKEQIVPWTNWSGKSLSGFASLSRKRGQGTASISALNLSQNQGLFQ